VSIIGNSDGDGLATIERTNCYLFHMNDEKREKSDLYIYIYIYTYTYVNEYT
jgi:hypothetical protein